MFLPLPTTSLFFRSPSRRPARRSSSACSSRDPYFSPQPSPQRISMREQVVRLSTMSQTLADSPSAARAGSQPIYMDSDENVYLVAACRRNGRRLNLMPDEVDGVYPLLFRCYQYLCIMLIRFLQANTPLFLLSSKALIARWITPLDDDLFPVLTFPLCHPLPS